MQEALFFFVASAVICSHDVALGASSEIILSEGKPLRLWFDVSRTHPALPEQVVTSNLRKYASNPPIAQFWAERRRARTVSYRGVLDRDGQRVAWRTSQEADPVGRTQAVTYNGEKTVVWWDSPQLGRQQMRIWPGLKLTEQMDLPFVLTAAERPPLIDVAWLSLLKETGGMKFFRSRSPYRPAERRKDEAPLLMDSIVKVETSSSKVSEVIVGEESTPYERWRFSQWSSRHGVMLPGHIEYVHFSQFPELPGKVLPYKQFTYRLVGSTEGRFAHDAFDANSPRKGTPVQDERYDEPPTARGGKPVAGGVSYYYAGKDTVDRESQRAALGPPDAGVANLTLGRAMRIVGAMGLCVLAIRVLLSRKRDRDVRL